MRSKVSLACLVTGRVLRSLSQGYLAVVVPLYLLSRGADAATVGVIVTVWSAGSAALALFGGFLGDRIGRKWVLLMFSAFNALAAVAFAAGAPIWMLAIAGAIGTFGRGGGPASGGAYGPYFSAEQALLAEYATPERRTRLFARFSFAGALAGAGSYALTHLPVHLLFELAIALGVAMTLSVLPLQEHRESANLERARSVALSRPTRSLLVRLGVTNATNGLAVGFLGPMLVLWFHVRYGASAQEIGRIYLIIALASTGMYLFVGRIVAAIGGAVRTIVTLRVAACVMLAIMPFMPSLWWAGACYLVRMLFNSVTLPVRQSFVMGIVPAEERGRAAALSNLPSQVCSMIGPAVAGALMRTLWIGTMLEAASLLQLLNAGLYWRFFHNVTPPEEREAA